MLNVLKDKQNFLKMIKNTGFVILGTFVLAFGVGMFIFPFNLVTGGVSGIGIVLQKLLSGVEILEDIGANFYSAIVNWILFIIGFFILGKQFSAKTLVSTAVYPFALWVVEFLIYDSPLSELLNMQNYQGEYQEIVLIIATVFGGACIGAGCAFTFLGGGSTGGIDVIALSLSKYIKKLKSSVAFFICDSTIIIAGALAINNIIITLLGVISAFICALTIDKLFLGESSAFIAHIVSNKYEEINEMVITKMQRTTTIVDAVGGYSGKGKKMVIVTFAMRQYALFCALMDSIDKNAFITVHRAHEINGEGWTYNEDKTEVYYRKEEE